MAEPSNESHSPSIESPGADHLFGLQRRVRSVTDDSGPMVVGAGAVQKISKTHPQFVLGVLAYWSRPSE
jgi:hypothetical protein